MKALLSFTFQVFRRKQKSMEILFSFNFIFLFRYKGPLANGVKMSFGI